MLHCPRFANICSRTRLRIILTLHCPRFATLMHSQSFGIALESKYCWNITAQMDDNVTGQRFLTVLGQHLGHDSALYERSQGISDMSLYRISSRIFLDGSGKGVELWCGCFLLPSWENGCQVGRVGNRPKKEITSFQNEVLYLQKCSQSRHVCFAHIPSPSRAI